MMEKLISWVAALGVPALVFVVAVGATGLTGAAAYTTALAALGGPLGMVGGLLSLGAACLITQLVTERGLRAVVTAVMEQLEKRGETRDSISGQINRMHLPSDLQNKIDTAIKEYYETDISNDVDG